MAASIRGRTGGSNNEALRLAPLPGPGYIRGLMGITKQSATPSAVCLLSGGMDSAVTAAWALRQGWEVAALTVHYGQRHQVELGAARRVARQLGLETHREIEIDLSRFGGSALTDDVEVPKHRSIESQPASNDIPVTYVPARNLVFLSLAVAWAEARGSNHVLIGANAVDYSGYPDCRPEFIAAFAETARLGTRLGVTGQTLTVEAPLIALSKREIVTLGRDLGVDFANTLSCYDPSEAGLACGGCDACQLRARGFTDANITDPTRYVTPPKVRP